MILVIAEKKEVALAIGRAVCGKNSERLPVAGNGYTVTAASGHLLELVEPEAYDPRLKYAGGDWTEEDLPIVFPGWRRDVKRALDDKGRKTVKPDEFASRRLDEIAGLAEKADVIVNAGDPDDEGQCLVDEIIEHIGYAGPVKRVYVNDTIEKNIAREFDRLVDNEGPKRDGEVAYARAMADMVFGVNDTRLLVKRTGLRNVSLGRVQTPVLRMVVERDRAIEGHVERLYYEAYVDLEMKSGEGVARAKVALSKDDMDRVSEDGKHVFERRAIEAAAEKAMSEGELVMNVTRRTERKSAPLPYNITQLEAEMSRMHGYSASETLAATQALRDAHSAITYNRTSSSYLKEEHWEEAPDVLRAAMANCGLEWNLDFALKSKAFDDAKVTAHHGIIPQETRVDVDGLPERERNVYMAIVKRYAMQFLPAAEHDVCKGMATFDGGELTYSASRLVRAGWTDFDEKERGDAEQGVMLESGRHECRPLACEVVEKKTAPPKRYTVESLLKDMASASKYVKDDMLRAAMLKKDEDDPDEHGGIGTSATRHSIIDTLVRRGFVAMKGKQVISTEKGRAVYDMLPDGLGTVDMTAKWYLIQEEIRSGKADADELPAAVAEEFTSRKETAYRHVNVPESLRDGLKKTIGKCPRCGLQIVEAKNSYQCESNRFEKVEEGWKRVAGCGWSFSKMLAGKRLTSRQAESLIAGKLVKISGLTSRKTGAKYDAEVQVSNPETMELHFRFGKNGKSDKKR